MKPKHSRKLLVSDRRSKVSNAVGLDHPFPERIATLNMESQMQMASIPIRPIRLEPGSRLAARFPHLTKGAVPTKGGDTEMEA